MLPWGRPGGSPVELVGPEGLAGPLGITLTAVAQHLQILEESGLARTEKLGRVRTCQAATAGFAVLDEWMRKRRTTWERRLDRLGDILNE